MLPCEVTWVLGIERSPFMDTWGAVGLRLGYDEQGHSPNVLLAARETTSCLIDQIAAPSAAAFLLPVPKLRVSRAIFATQRKTCSRRLVNSNDLDALVCKRVLQSATEIRRLAKSTDEKQMLVTSLD